MRRLSPSTQFAKDLAREKRGEYRKLVRDNGRLDQVIEKLANDIPLPINQNDHPMSGMKGVRNCHIAPDLILLYGKPNDDDLELYRLGTHSELGI